ncbi:MAG: glycosyltransferase family 4 protein, partial [Pirellulaceae bacterium]|nr:glycosyltransferase family 4 protein [Pirellulaceae bacterium]
AIQPDEQQILSRLVPENRVVLVGHAEDCRSSPCTSSDLCFVGSRYVVNEDSLLHFVRDAWPAIRASCPETKLQVAGGVSQSPGVVAAAQQDDRIVLRGIVPQVKDIYAGPAVMICPMAVGSGLKIKMVEALAHGKAVVGTPIAAQGLAAGVNSAFQVAERPADFVGPIIRLLRNPQEREHWEQAALRFAREHLAEEPVWREMKARLDQWRSRPRVRRAA